jgi:hypothetical protein
LVRNDHGADLASRVWTVVTGISAAADQTRTKYQLRAVTLTFRDRRGEQAHRSLSRVLSSARQMA